MIAETSGGLNPSSVQLEDQAHGRAIYGVGEMTGLTRNLDWTRTSIGPIGAWPDVLLSTVNMLLASSHPMFLWWGEDLIQFYNDGYRPSIGADKHPKALGQTGRQCWPEIWHIIGPQIESVRSSGVATWNEDQLVPIYRDGHLVDVYWTYGYSPVRDLQGKIHGVLVVCSETTGRMAAEQHSRKLLEELRQSEEKLRLSLTAAQGVGLWDWDVPNDLVYADERFARLYGVDPSRAASGVTIAEFTRNMHPHDRPRVSENIDAALRTGDEFCCEYRLLQSDGSVRWVLALGRCAISADGTPLRFPGVTIDITNRKTVEAELTTSEERLRIATQTAQLGTWELELATGRMELSSVCKANFGWPADAPFSYEDLVASVYPDDRPQMQAAVRKALDTHSVYRAEYRILRPDGTTRQIVASGQPMYDDEDKPKRIVGVTLDVTERHQREAALLQSEKLAAVGRLASSIAHEINNPLESVTNLIYLARQNAILPVVQQYLDSAEQELRRVSVIANQTLRFHKQSTSAVPVTCENLFQSVLTIYQSKLTNSNVTVVKRKRSEKPVCCFDGEIRQVLSNLIGNSIDAMHPKGGRLCLRSRESTDWSTGRKGLILTVADEGAGMSKETIAKIFEPFFTTKGQAGTGLGLWVTQEIVTRHKGALKVRSRQAEDRSGTVFALFLPFDFEGRKA